MGLGVNVLNKTVSWGREQMRPVWRTFVQKNVSSTIVFGAIADRVEDWGKRAIPDRLYVLLLIRFESIGGSTFKNNMFEGALGISSSFGNHKNADILVFLRVMCFFTRGF